MKLALKVLVAYADDEDAPLYSGLGEAIHLLQEALDVPPAIPAAWGKRNAQFEIESAISPAAHGQDPAGHNVPLFAHIPPCILQQTDPVAWAIVNPKTKQTLFRKEQPNAVFKPIPLYTFPPTTAPDAPIPKK